MVVGTAGMGTWARASFPVPQNPIQAGMGINAGAGMGTWAPASFPVPQNPIMAGIMNGLAGLGQLDAGLGYWANTLTGPFFPTVWDRMVPPPPKKGGVNGIGTWSPARFPVPQNPIAAGMFSGAGMGNSAAQYDTVYHAGVDCTCKGKCGPCQEQAGLGAMGNVGDFSIQDTFGGMDMTTVAMLAGGVLLVMFLVGRPGGRSAYKAELASADASYKRKVARVKRKYAPRGARLADRLTEKFA